MPEPYVEIIDRFGRRRRARRGEVAGDGETVHFGMQFMDGTARAVRDALAEKFGPYTGDDDMLNDQRPRGYVRGFAFSDTTVALAARDTARFADAAERAYAERSRAWPRPGAARTRNRMPEMPGAPLRHIHAPSIAIEGRRSTSCARSPTPPTKPSASGWRTRGARMTENLQEAWHHETQPFPRPRATKLDKFERTVAHLTQQVLGRRTPSTALASVSPAGSRGTVNTTTSSDVG